MVSVVCVLDKKCLPTLKVTKIFCHVSSKHFIVLVFMFQSITHVEIFFVNGARYGSRFTSFQLDIKLSHHHLLKEIIFRLFLIFSLQISAKGRHLEMALFFTHNIQHLRKNDRTKRLTTGRQKLTLESHWHIH